jgi:mannose-6-phosphate isomerase
MAHVAAPAASPPSGRFSGEADAQVSKISATSPDVAAAAALKPEDIAPALTPTPTPEAKTRTMTTTTPTDNSSAPNDVSPDLPAAAQPPSETLAAPAVPANFDNPLHPYVVPIIPAVKTYAWGIRGPDSAVATLYARSGAGAAVHPAIPLAELWIGTHPSTPCKILTPETDSTEFLKEFVDDQVILVDPSQLTRYAELHQVGLPFLLKVLSIAKPLSIQAHPDKKRSAILHDLLPDIYKDPNHKPELAVALTPFEAMCGFRSCIDIVTDIARVPEFADAAVRTVADDFVRVVKSRSFVPKRALRALFSSLMSRSHEDIKHSIENLVARLGSMAKSDLTARDHLLLHLNSEFPGDIGCFGAYLFNHVHLAPGQAIFIQANEPHAYIKGQCLEIMACSDNVVRAGLTPKLKDVDTLVDILSYNDAPIEIMEGIRLDNYATVYAPPVDEFLLIKYELPPGATCDLQATTAPTIIVGLAGDGFIRLDSRNNPSSTHALPLSAGCSYILKSDMTFAVSASSPTYFGSAKALHSPLVFFRAGTNEAAITSGTRCSIM